MTAARTERPVAMVDLCVTEKLDLACLPDAGLAFDGLSSMHSGYVVVEPYRRLHICGVGGPQLDVYRQLARRHALLFPRAPNARNRRVLQIGGVDRVLPLAVGPQWPAANRPDQIGPAPTPSTAVTDCVAGWPVTGHRNPRNCTTTEAST